MQISRTGTFVAGVLLTLVVGGGTAVASGGASLVLGKANPSKATTAISNSKGTPLSLTAKKGYPPLKVNSSAKVKHLDADLLDGKDSSQFLGATGTAANSNLLAGQSASAYLQSVYFASTVDTAQDPTLYHHTSFDLMTVPAGTYAVHLAAQVQNNDNVAESVICELAFKEAAGVDLGQTGTLGLFAKAP